MEEREAETENERTMEFLSSMGKALGIANGGGQGASAQQQQGQPTPVFRGRAFQTALDTVADPAPVMQAISNDAALTENYRLDGVITLVDGVQGADQLKHTVEAVKQAAVADRIVITKSDLTDQKTIDNLLAELKAINPNAGITVAQDGIAPEAVDRWLGPAQEEDHGHEHEHHEHGHTHNIVTFTLWFDQPFKRATFERCVELLTSLRGADLLRVKGLVNVEGETGPVVIQGVQHLFHPPVTLAAWPGNERRSRLVFITRGIQRETVANLFAAVMALG